MYENNIALFLCQIKYLLYDNDSYYNQNLANSINSFIILHHKEYEEQFNLLYQKELLQEIINDDYIPLPENYIINILNKYQEYENYLKLIESLDENEVLEITDLAHKFMEFLQESIELHNVKPYLYSKIPQ